MKEVEKAKKTAEISKKLESAKRELKSKRDYLEEDIGAGRDVTKNAIEVKYAARRVGSLQKELEKLR